MKNRRLTILFIVMTIGGSPQVWQRLGDLIATVQHKAQIKFLSMVLSPRAGDDGAETTENARVEHPALCKAAAFDRAEGESQAKPDSSPRKTKTPRRAASINSEERGALALTDAVKGEAKFSSQHLNPAGSENRLAMHGVGFAPAEMATVRSNVVEVVVLPQINSFAPAFVDVGNTLKLKKTFEQTKAFRQKIHYVIGRPTQPPPPLRTDSVSAEREG